MNRLGLTSRIALFGSAAALALTLGSAANAQVQEQQVPPQEDQSAQVQEQQASPQDDQSASEQGNPDIVVTAQKREERIQDVPISISVVNQEQILDSGSSQLVDYAAYVPGFQVDNAGSPGRSTLSLRGVAPIGPSATVGIYLDDAPIGSSGIYNRSQVFTLDLLPYDIQRLEVLRGPQGTLYGASSIGGLLKYVTVQPDLARTRVRAGGEIFDVAHGDGLGWGINVMGSVPIIKDQLAVSASYSRRDTPGFVDNILTGDDDVNDSVQKGGRLALLWQPASNLKVQLTALKQKTENQTALGSFTKVSAIRRWRRAQAFSAPIRSFRNRSRATSNSIRAGLLTTSASRSSAPRRPSASSISKRRPTPRALLVQSGADSPSSRPRFARRSSPRKFA